MSSGIQSRRAFSIHILLEIFAYFANFVVKDHFKCGVLRRRDMTVQSVFSHFWVSSRPQIDLASWMSPPAIICTALARGTR